MDNEFALRLVLTEYVYPQQRRKKHARALNASLRRTMFESGRTYRLTNKMSIERVMMHLIRISDGLLSTVGGCNSLILPSDMGTYGPMSRSVDALLDPNVLTRGEYWQGVCPMRVADPMFGLYVYDAHRWM